MIVDIEKLKGEVGEKLKAAREERGLSQEELARMLGLSKVGYGALERGKNLIGLQYLVMLTFLLKKPITDFLPAYVVSNSERNSPMLDPRFAELATLWPDLNEKDRSFILRIATRFHRK